MGYYIDKNGNYYEGDRLTADDAEVPRRPDADHTWDGKAWASGPQPVPSVVSMRQAQRALLARGHLPQIETAIASMPGQAGQEARIDWATATDVERSWPLVKQIGAALSMTDAQLDDLFRYAATL